MKLKQRPKFSSRKQLPYYHSVYIIPSFINDPLPLNFLCHTYPQITEVTCIIIMGTFHNYYYRIIITISNYTSPCKYTVSIENNNFNNIGNTQDQYKNNY